MKYIRAGRNRNKLRGRINPHRSGNEQKIELRLDFQAGVIALRFLALADHFAEFARMLAVKSLCNGFG